MGRHRTLGNHDSESGAGDDAAMTG